MATKITLFLVTLVLTTFSSFAQESETEKDLYTSDIEISVDNEDDLDQDFDKTFRDIFDMFKENTDLSKEVSLKFTVKEIKGNEGNTKFSNLSFKVSGPASEADALYKETLKRTDRIKKMVKKLSE
ncbi:hypothetical protein [Spongiivirga citrea]|uniref:DUF3568 family protein n=1 Tax=Spongiivirga citrea TaxID=1481457 RepID=A0A6M0CMF3_9FLAO|nr:hypothetical protein [Spongiivirga citrea]NER18832.1 hypothetical protein [Spongiivirga citrea]